MYMNPSMTKDEALQAYKKAKQDYLNNMTDENFKNSLK